MRKHHAWETPALRVLLYTSFPSLKHLITSHPMAFRRHLFPIFILTAFLSSARRVSSHGSTAEFPSNSSLRWKNSDSPTVRTRNFDGGCLARVILSSAALPRIYGGSLAFAFGFYCDRRSHGSCILAVMVLEFEEGAIRRDRPPQLVWMANRDRPVKENATLRASRNRGLVLTDADGVDVWRTKKTHSVGAVTLRNNGNLVLSNGSNPRIWKSFDHPADTLLMGQQLRGKRRLTSSVSRTNSSTGKFYLSVTNSTLTAFVRYARPVAYIRLPPGSSKYGTLRYVAFNPRSMNYFYKKGGDTFVVNESLSTFTSTHLLRMDPDGGLRVYIWHPERGWQGLRYSLGGNDQCQKPLVCGSYGVCVNEECSCPTSSDGTVYFKPLYPESPGHGCEYTDAFGYINSTEYKQHLVNFGSLSYFSYFDPTAAIHGLNDLEACKNACRRDPSCKAAFFEYRSNASGGLCYLPSEILSIKSLRADGDTNGSVAFLKVPIPPDIASSRSLSPSTIRKISLVVASVSILAVASMSGFIAWKIRGRKSQVGDCFDRVIGAPTRFCYRELCSATGRFGTRLGRGGFGTVYRGELKDGTEIAVKRLDCVEQRMDEFVAEMKTVGSIHHMHLVKLIGYCAEKSDRLLVYQYMSNGSLDRWIFREDRKESLGWETRRRIILGVAQGLAYLHEGCSERIAHLDVKPHNILLDENFDAKISDFGLARFIGRNQSHLVTGVKGTFGYLAPEWQHLKITVKADIYSFGIVMLETVCGRMVLDYSLDGSDCHLLGVLERKARDGAIVDVVDKKIPGWESNREDILKMIDIAVWCLNGDQSQRPSMSTVVRILEGTMDFERPVDFNFDHALVLSNVKKRQSSALAQANGGEENRSATSSPATIKENSI